MEFMLLLLALCGLAVQAGPMHLALLLVHSAAGGWIAWRLLRKQPLTAFFIVVYVTMYFPNPIAVILGWVPPDSSDAVFYQSNVLIMLGFDLFLFAARRLRITRKDANRMPRLQLNSLRVDVCVTVCIAISAISLAVLIAMAGRLGLDPFTMLKSEIVGAGAHTEYYLVARYCLMLLPLAAFLIGLKRPIWQIPYLLPIGVLLLVHFGVFRNRQIPVGIMFGYVVALIAKNYVVRLGRREIRGRLPQHIRLAVALGLPLIAVIAVSIKYLRASYGRGEWAVERQRVQELVAHTFAGGDFGLAVSVRMALRLFPDQHPFLLGQSYYRLLFIPIPRSVWPDKPQNTQRIFAATLDPELGRRNVTIPAGLVGDQYINFGYAGVLCMLVYGFLFANERYRGLTDLLFLSGAALWMIFLARGSSTVPVVVLLVVWIASAIITRFLRPQVIPRQADRPPAMVAAPGALNVPAQIRS